MEERFEDLRCVDRKLHNGIAYYPVATLVPVLDLPGPPGPENPQNSSDQPPYFLEFWKNNSYLANQRAYGVKSYTVV